MKFLKKTILILLPLILLFGSCSGKENYIESSFVAMDTVISFKVSEGEYDETAIIAECEELLSEIENTISKTAEESDTSIANTDIDMMLEVSPIFEEVTALSLDYSRMTGGAFDITVGGLKNLWEKCSEEGREPTAEEIETALRFVGYDSLTLDNSTLEKRYKETRLDFGAIGKGYAAQKLVQLLEEKGVSGAILSFGGNVALVGAKQSRDLYKVGVKDPYNTADVIGYLSLDGGFVSVSGDYERYIGIGDKKYNHIIDPSTVYPIESGLHSVSVISDNGALADALSTALFVMGKDAAIEFYNSAVCDFEAVFVTDDGVFATAGLKDVFSPQKSVKVTFEGVDPNGN